MLDQDVKIGRNDPCHCGSGKKYKKCCLPVNIRAGDSALVDPGWRELKQLEQEVYENHLLPYCNNMLSKELLELAWDDFTFDTKLPDELCESISRTLFFPWVFYDWCEGEEDGLASMEESDGSLAMRSLHDNKNLPNKYRQFIEAMNLTYYSFYLIVEVKPLEFIVVKDILLNTQHTVIECQQTDYVRGDILFARILTLNGISLFVGSSPCLLPSKYHLELLDYREELANNYGDIITEELLKTENWNLRFMYFDLLREAHENPMPKLQNTDGDPLEFCTLKYSLNIEPQEAFERLTPLIYDRDPEPFLYDAKRYKDGRIKQINIDWSKAGNKLHKQWDNTVLGSIFIRQSKMTIEVNSQNRVKKIKKLITRYLGDNAIYEKTTIMSVEEIIQTIPKSILKHASHQSDISVSPEAQALIMKQRRLHWENWLDSPIPALGGLSPKEAAKNERWREYLEALLFQIENSMIRSPMNFDPNIDELRHELGL